MPTLEFSRRRAALLSTATAAALLLTACGSDSDSDAEEDNANEEAQTEVTEIEDDHGTQELPEDPDSIVATDNRSFRTLEEFGVELTAAPQDIMDPETHSYAEDEDILNLGNHREPDFEQLVAAEPDLIINGQRFAQYYEDLEEYAPDATIVEFELDEEGDETLDENLIHKTEALGEIFGEQEAAEELVTAFQDEIDRATEAYDGESTVMGLVTSGGDINYAAPSVGRAVGPLFDMVPFEPALEVDDASTDHEGDDISVEAIADSDPEWLIVMDRDARMSGDEGEEYSPAQELIEESEALQDVPAVQNDQVIYMPDNLYLTEDIQAYTEALASIADAMEEAQDQ